MFDTPYVRFSAEDYHIDDFKNIFSQLTNNSIAKHSEKFHETNIEGDMWEIEQFKNYLVENYGKDYYIYSDTDSIHMLKLEEEELKRFIDIDDFTLGAWKLESTFRRGKFIRQKCYIEEDYDNEIHVTVAGLPKKLGKYITFDNFKVGFTIKADEEGKEHKLTYKHVNGGALLVDTDFTIK